MSKGLKILLVDDHDDTANMMRLLVERWGHHVDTAGNVSEAGRLAGLVPYDVLICDYSLPDGDGCDLLAGLLQHRPIVGIAVTGRAFPEDIERSLSAGYTAHLSKPVDLEKLRKILDSVEPH